MKTQMCTYILLPLVLLLAGILNAETLYRDPQGRFSIVVPTGWNQNAMQGSLQLTRGDASAVLMLVDGQGTPPEMVNQVLGQIGRQWKDVKQVGSPEAKLAGQPAAFSLITGINPKGVQAFAGVYAVNVGGQMYVLIQTGPISQYQQLAKDLDQIAGSFSQGSGAMSNSAPKPMNPVAFPAQPARPLEAPGGNPGAGTNYEAPDRSVSFRVPAGWKVRTADLGGTPVQVVERDGHDEKILVNAGVATANSIQEFAQQAAQLVTQQILAGYRVASAPRFSQMNGAPTAEISYTGTGGGGQTTWWHLLTMKDGQFLSVLGGGLSNQSQFVQQTTQAVFQSARMGKMEQNTRLAQAIIGRWTWSHRTDMPGGSGGASTSKQIVFAPNGRFEYQAASYVPGLSPDIDPTTRVSGRYQVTGNTVIATFDNGQRATYNVRLIQGGALEINGEVFIRE